jgi:hypothetical protein
MPSKWHICKQGQAGNKNRQRRGLLVFSELPSLPSAGSRPGCFHTSLGSKPRSLIRVLLGLFYAIRFGWGDVKALDQHIFNILF